MQTSIVHAREPIRFVSDLGAVRAVVAAILVLGAVVTALTWPIFTLSTLWRLLQPDGDSLTRGREAADVFVYLLSAAGMWSIAAPVLVAARQRGLRVGAAVLAALPLYYGLISLAAWTAIADLIVRPHFWAKTEHGRAGRKPVPAGALRRERDPVDATSGAA